MSIVGKKNPGVLRACISCNRPMLATGVRKMLGNVVAYVRIANPQLYPIHDSVSIFVPNHFGEHAT